MTMSNNDLIIKKFLDDELVIKRFKSHLEVKSDGCIEWTGYRTAKGYGKFNIFVKVNTRTYAVRAHRFAYALHYGIDKLPSGTDKTHKRMVIHHKCENKSCVNPLHLESVTDRWNLGIVNDKNMY